MASELAAIFQGAGLIGHVCAQDAHGAREVALSADEPMVAGSVFKVLVAVEVLRQVSSGRLDPAERVVLSPERRTPGPVGFSLYQDEVQLSLRDLLVPMLTLSDNVATDALLALVGVDACNGTAADLGLTQTVIVGDLRGAVDGIGRAAGFASWNALVDWSAAPHSTDEELEVERRIRAAPSLDPATATRTTARDMCVLLRQIWTDRAGSPAACRRIRNLMSRQLTRDRIAAAFDPPVKVSAKSGGLVGLFRHEVGVVEYPDASWYPVAVLTRAAATGRPHQRVNQAIGRAAAHGIAMLRTG
jgi:beta-lactamase class A